VVLEPLGPEAALRVTGIAAAGFAVVINTAADTNAVATPARMSRVIVLDVDLLMRVLLRPLRTVSLDGWGPRVVCRSTGRLAGA
jgi:hypothetical protein